MPDAGLRCGPPGRGAVGAGRRTSAGRRVGVALLGGVVLYCSATACTSDGSVGTTGTVGLSRASAQSSAAPTPASRIPVTPDGLVTGPGVTDTQITLGLLSDPTLDRGFAAGARLWSTTVTANGGICGRAVMVSGGVDPDPASARYATSAQSVLGFLALPDAADAATLAESAAADGVPVLEPGGPSSALTTTGPVVLAATDDIAAIDAASFLTTSGVVPTRATMAVVTDSSASAANTLAGLRWWAGRNGVTLVQREAGAAVDLRSAAAVVVAAGPGTVDAVLAGTAANTPVLTGIDGYDPARVSTTDQRRLYVMTPTPAFGSDNPAAAAVARAFTQQRLSDPGPRALVGYAVAATWGRLLEQACTRRDLTRAGVRAALGAVGPASVDSLLGPADPGQVAAAALPATRVASVARADSSAPAGLIPLEWMAAAPDIADYTPTR